MHVADLSIVGAILIFIFLVFGVSEIPKFKRRPDDDDDDDESGQ